MATLYDYAIMAQAIYEDEEYDMIDKLVQGGCSDLAVRFWQARTSSNGFQGAILENDREVVCVFKGSKSGKSFVQDFLVNDVEIAINLIPSQSHSAAEMVAAAETICGGQANRSKPLSLTGHSLGGGLAQLVGYLRGAPFVTFNAPGMMGNIELVPFLYRGTKPGGKVNGFNMILWTDPIGNYGRHIGKTERFVSPPFGPSAVIAHLMPNVIAVLNRKPDWATKMLSQIV